MPRIPRFRAGIAECSSISIQACEWFFGRRFHTRGEAPVEAEDIKARYLKDGVLLS